MKDISFDKDIRFECQSSSYCCVSRGQYGFVYLSKKDIRRLSKFIKLNIKDFINLYCDKTNGYTHLKEKKRNGNCQFLKNKKCSVYKGRPTQCRTWPFWDENMNAKQWNEEISKFCPGIGKGQIITKERIRKKINEDKQNEYDILNES